MKKEGKISLLIIIILVVSIIFLNSFNNLKLTGNIIKEQKAQIQFSFSEESTNCPLNGYVFVENKPIGKTKNGTFNLSYENYLANVGQTQTISIFGKLGNCFTQSELYFDKYFEIPKIEKYHFLGETSFKFKTKINPHNPVKRELLGFILKNGGIKQALNTINLENHDTFNALSKINNYLNNKIKYVDDWDFNKEENYWQTPEETLIIKSGDCEDYSTSLLSLISAYNSSLNCYNIILTSHVTTFCHINDYYIYYDQERTELRKQIKKGNPNIKQELKTLQKDYYEYYGINDSETRPYYAFNDYEYIEFNNNQEFIDWQANLPNTKQQIDLFQDIEKQIIQNTENLPSTDLSSELTTQRITLPNLKSFPYLIIIPIIIFAIILIFILIKINRKPKKKK